MIRRQEALDRHHEASKSLPMLSSAQTYWVNEDMLRLIHRAATCMPSEVFVPLDIPSQRGIILLEGSLGGASALSWEADTESCRVTLWSLYEGRMLKGGTARVPFGEKWEPPILSRGPKLWNGYVSKGSDAWWEYGPGIAKESYKKAAQIAMARTREALKKPRPIDHSLKIECDSSVSIMRFPKAFWSIIEEKLVCVSNEKPERYVRRRLAREGSGLADREVKYVSLRRVEYKRGEGEREVDWSCRWLVDGHWRNQWHPSKKMHRQRFILPYVKGPEDKPLVLKDTLNLVVR